MLSINLIERHFQARRFEPLLAGLAANGTVLPLPLQARLLQSEVAPAALALRRLIELTYEPIPLARQMTRLIVTAQHDDGSIEHDPLATAAAVAALGRVIADQPAVADEAVCIARQHALAALAAMQNETGLFNSPDDRTEQDRALTGAFILYLLVGDDQFRQAVRFADLMTWYEQHRDRLDDATNQLWEIARLEMTVPPEPDAALVALAA